MSPVPLRLAIALALWGIAWSTAARSDAPDASAGIDFAVLTPSMDGTYHVASGLDPTALLPPFVPFGSIANREKTDDLRRLVAREHYDPARTIADRLIEALAEASIRAVYEPIGRKPAGTIQSLSWEDLPESPQAELMLDLNIRWICLCSEVAFTKYFPAISIGWRVLGADRSVVEPTRTLVYQHYPARRRKPARTVSTAARPRSAPEYPVVAVSESCGFDSVEDAEKNPPRLWGCLAEAYDAAVRRLVIDLKRIHPPHGAATASGDNPS